MPVPVRSLWERCLAEAVGTFILVFLGCGAVHSAVLIEAQAGLWQVAIVWGLAVTLAIYVAGGISGAHINPAMTLAFAVWGRFPWSGAASYVVFQVAGAFAAAALQFAIFAPYLSLKEQEKRVVRGGPGSEITAMCYGEYFPSPSGAAARSAPEQGEQVAARLEAEQGLVPAWAAFLAEALATGLLALVVFAVTDPRNDGAPPPGLAAPFIGLTVAALISVVAPLTQACFNPARDFGPRLFAALAGWGSVALPGPRFPGFFTVYILAPAAGAIAGGGLWTILHRPAALAPQEVEKP
jgi:glycerol uptake facilitator protein